MSWLKKWAKHLSCYVVYILINTPSSKIPEFPSLNGSYENLKLLLEIPNIKLVILNVIRTVQNAMFGIWVSRDYERNGPRILIEWRETVLAALAFWARCGFWVRNIINHCYFQFIIEVNSVMHIIFSVSVDSCKE